LEQVNRAAKKIIVFDVTSSFLHRVIHLKAYEKSELCPNAYWNLQPLIYTVETKLYL